MIFTAAEGWGEKEICIKRGSDRQKEGKGKGWRQDRKLEKLTRPEKTLALQGSR